MEIRAGMTDGCLIPPEQGAEFFGCYNMVGKFATIIGPALMGGVAAITHNPRLGILAIIVLFVAGAALLLRVKTGDIEGGRLERSNLQ